MEKKEAEQAEIKAIQSKQIAKKTSDEATEKKEIAKSCLLYTSPSPRD